MLDHGFLPPIKDAKTYKILLRKYNNRLHSLRRKSIEMGGYEWTLICYHSCNNLKYEQGLGCSLTCTDNRFDEEMLIEYRVAVLNHISPNKTYGVVRRAWLKQDNVEAITDFVCSRELIVLENGGYLENGDLTVLFQLRVHLFVDQILGRHFNFLDPIDDCFVFHSRGDKLHVKKKLLYLHSPVIASMMDLGVNQIEVNCGIRVFEDILKTMHGSNASESRMELQLSFAKRFKMSTVVSVLEKKLISRSSPNLIDTALLFNLPKFYKHCLREIDSVQELKESVENANIDLMCLELMKVLVLKFFSFAKPFVPIHNKVNI